MPEPRSIVRNAADPQQVKRGERKEHARGERLTALHKAQLSTYVGREFVYDLLERAGIYRSIWFPSAEIHYLSGRQDYGHELRERLLASDEEGFYLMEREARERAKRDDRETDAAHTRSVSDNGGGDAAGA